jgi:hypothetical protein
MTVYINGTTGYSGPVGTIGDLTTTGNTTLGDASGDTLTINGSTTTLTQGTANGVAYLNGSKVLTTGSALTFSGGALGVTSSTTTALNLTGATACQINLNDGTQNANWGLGVGGVGITGIASPSTYPLVFYTNATERMRLDSSGNLGLGVTPSAWASPFKAIQGGGGGYSSYFAFQSNTYACKTGVNHYYNGSNYVYAANAAAARFDINENNFNWNIAASGTAGSTITFTQAMTLDASGNLGIGSTSPSSFLSTQRRLVIGAGSGDIGQTIYTGSSSQGTIAFADGLTGDQQYRGYIAYIHSSDALTFGSAGAERMRISSAGAVTIAGYDVLTNNQGTQASFNSYTAMTGGVAYKIGQLPQAVGMYAISIHMDSGTNSNGDNIYWESAWGAVIGAIGGNLYNATGAIQITVNSMYHHLTVPQPTFYIDSDNSTGNYGNQSIYVVFPQYTNVQGMTFFYKKLM